MRRFTLARPALLAALVASTGAAPQDGSAWDPLIAQARADGLRHQQTEDGDAKSAAKKALREAEKLIRDALKRDPACERCHEGFVTVAFQQAYFGVGKSYKEFFEIAAESQAEFPANGKIALYKGTAHYNTGEAGDALRSLRRYLASPARDRDTDAMVQSMVQASQQAFHSGWNRHANFYQSPESQIVVMNPQTFVNEVVFQATPEWELTAAAQAVPGILQHGAPRQDPELQAYLEALVGKLINGSPGSPFRYRLTVIDSPAVNAVTVPGEIVVFTGLLQFVDTEAELAGVLAHELAHNYGHHSARAVIKQWHAQNVANLVTGAAAQQGQTAAQVSALVTNLGVNLFVRAYSRAEEKEADLYGTHILYNAGYNPTAMSEFNLKMYRLNPKQPVKFLSTHPPSPDRATYLTEYLEAFDLQQTLAVDSGAFQKMKQKFPSAQPSREGSQGVLPPGTP